MVDNQSSGNSLCCFVGTRGTCDQQLKARYSRPGFYVVSCGLWEGYYLLSSAASIYLCYVKKKHVYAFEAYKIYSFLYDFFRHS